MAYGSISWVLAIGRQVSRTPASRHLNRAYSADFGSLRGMPHKQITLIFLVTAAVSIPSSAGASEYRNLCTSAASYCTPTGPDAPQLHADVCLSRTGAVTLKGTAPCASDTWPYYIDHGEVVDPTTGQVQPYLPLDDACGQAGMCDKGPPPGDSQELPMCCYVDELGDQVCVYGANCGGTVWFCYDGVSNPDGTVTCFSGEQLG